MEKLGMVTHASSPSIWKTHRDCCEFKASLDHRIRPYLKNQTTAQTGRVPRMLSAE